MLKPCDCIGPGYCPRHNMIKTKGLYEKCQKDERYRKLWDEQAGSCGKKQLPSMMERLKNLSTALYKHIASGFKKVKEAVYRQRLEICEPCPSHQQGKCIECGCFLHIKAEWATEDCPLGKWPKLELPMIDEVKNVNSGCGGCGRK